MNREILLRYVLKNKHTGKIHFKVYSIEQIEREGLKGLFDIDNYEILHRDQSTGLQDSNERTIFNGDSVNFTFFTYHEYEVEETKKGVIWFNGTAFYFVEKTEDNEINYLLDELTFDSKSDIEITDNIHEK